MKYSCNLRLVPVEPFEEGSILLSRRGTPLSAGLAGHRADVLCNCRGLVGNQECSKSSPVHQIDCLHTSVTTRNISDQEFGHDTSTLL